MDNKFVAPRELSSRISKKEQLYDTLEVDCKSKGALMTNSGHGATAVWQVTALLPQRCVFSQEMLKTISGCCLMAGL